MDNLTYRFQQMMRYAATRGRLFFCFYPPIKSLTQKFNFIDLFVSKFFRLTTP